MIVEPISDEAAEKLFEEFIINVEYIINLHLNACDPSMVTMAEKNMHEKLNEYIMTYTNLVINDLKEEGSIVSN